MMSGIENDERSLAISRSGGYYAYLVMCWLLAVELAVRSWKPELLTHAALPLDVLIVLAGGALTQFGYTLWWRASGGRRIVFVLLSFLVAAVAAAVMTAIWR